MEKENIINKKKVIICIGIFIIFILLMIVICSPKEKNSINGLIIENTNLYSKPIESSKKIKEKISEKTNVKIKDSLIKDNKEWYQVVVNNKKGYVLSEDIDYYKKSTDSKRLVADFSSHNFKYTFKTVNDVEAFLLKYDVSNVYIRAGGRGYGDEGNFYTDEKYKSFAEACEYLGIEYGYYFLDEALDNREIDEEVKFIKNFMEKNKSNLCTLPIVLDVEDHEGKGRCAEIWETRASIVNRLIKKLNSENFETILYSNANTWNTYLDSLKTELWLAYYPQDDFIPDYWYTKTDQPATENVKLKKNLVGWQFSENGVKHVIKENIDLNLFDGEFLDRKK